MITTRAVRRKAVIVGGLSLAALATALILHVSIGRGGMTIEQAWSAFLGSPQKRTHELILGIRVPRAYGAILAGAALAAAGAILQTVMRNPLAEPGLIGVSGGAALGVVAAVFAGLSLPGGILTNAVAGAIAAPLVIFAVCRDRWSSPSAIALSGTLIGALLTTLTSALLVTHGQSLAVVLRWIIGSLNPVSWTDIEAALPLFVGGSLIAVALLRPLGILRLPEQHAVGLGSRTTATRALALVAAVALTTSGVVIAGAVPFIGLFGAHLARRLVGSSPSLLIPIAALLGALTLLIADLLAMRATLALPWTDSEVSGLPVGALIAPLGAPYLIWLIRRRTT